jgi:uncharacterized protein YecE (DUF72 family)
MSEIRIGISGWTYPLWRKTFYPEGVPAKRELEYAADRFATIEVNGSFYRLQKPATFQDWYERAPEHLVYSIKGNRYITHVKRIKDVEPALANFFATGPLELREKLGPILWQFPPNMKFDEARFRKFFELLPRTPKEAVSLARKHDMQISGDDVPLVARTTAKLRYAVEIRNDTFKTDKFVDLLREFGIAYVIADTAERWVYAEDLTADFVYMRLHGYKELYSGGYTDEAIEMWSDRIRSWSRGKPTNFAQTIAKHVGRAKKKDVFCYFDNDAKVNAPFDAASLMKSLSDMEELVLPTISPQETLAARKKVSKKFLHALQPRAQNR